MYLPFPWWLLCTVLLVNLKNILSLSLAKKSFTNSLRHGKGLKRSAGEVFPLWSRGSGVSESRGSSSDLTYLVGQQLGKLSWPHAALTLPTRPLWVGQLMHLGFYQTNLLPSQLHDLSNTSQGESQCYYNGAYFTLRFGRLWWVMVVCECVCGVHTSLCFVTGYDGWCSMYANVYGMHSLFCQTVTDDDGAAHTFVRQGLCVLYACVGTCLIWSQRPEVLFGGWWIKPSQRGREREREGRDLSGPC